MPENEKKKHGSFKKDAKKIPPPEPTRRTKPKDVKKGRG
jgi:hypothetical protein